MKLSRLILPALLFLIAVPSFAVCTICDFNCNCTFEAGSGTHCKPTRDCCIENPSSCMLAADARPILFAADFTIASVEVTTPAKHVVTTSAPRQAERIARPDPHTR